MKKLLSLVLALTLAVSLAGCGAPASSTPASGSAPASTGSDSVGSAAAPAALPTVDRAGNAIVLPETVTKVISMAPSITQTLIDLGCADKIIATDTQSVGTAGLSEGLPAFDMMAPDAEQLAALAPDLLFVSGISMVSGENPFQPLLDLGVCIVTVPTSESIAAIYDDILFLGQVMGKTGEAEAINASLKAEIDRIAAIGATVTEKKTVYFEIASAPYAYSFGSDVYMDEMIQLIGAANALAGQSGWLSVDPEMVVAANPDVILTNVNYIEDPVGELLNRDGWGDVNAIQNQQVYSIDNLSSSLPNENIVTALQQMGKAVYPDLFS